MAVSLAAHESLEANMFLGRYDFDGDPDTLLGAYDAMMDAMPADGISFHICIRHDGGIMIYDACPSAEVFAEFSSSPQTRAAMSSAGLPEPVVTPLGEAHAARASADYLTGGQVGKYGERSGLDLDA